MNPHTVLLEQIDRSFNLNELKTICHNLRVDFDNLEGEGKVGKARELVAYLERRGHLKILLSELARLRPNVEWPNVSKGNDSVRSVLPSEWIDTTYQFIGITGGKGNNFRLRMFRREKTAVVVVSQLVSTEISLMNVVEHIATDILNVFELSPEFLVFIEHYPPDYLHDRRETYELVQFNWNGIGFSEPRWRPISKVQAEALVMHSL